MIAKGALTWDDREISLAGRRRSLSEIHRDDCQWSGDLALVSCERTPCLIPIKPPTSDRVVSGGPFLLASCCCVRILCKVPDMASILPGGVDQGPVVCIRSARWQILSGMALSCQVPTIRRPISVLGERTSRLRPQARVVLPAPSTPVRRAASVERSLDLSNPVPR
jgi:hypothetical protein